MFDVDYVYLVSITSKVLDRTAKLRSIISSNASPFYYEKMQRLYHYTLNLHKFFSSYRIESLRTLNQVRAYFNAVLLNLSYLQESEYNTVKSTSTRKLIGDVGHGRGVDFRPETLSEHAPRLIFHPAATFPAQAPQRSGLGRAFCCSDDGDLFCAALLAHAGRGGFGGGPHLRPIAYPGPGCELSFHSTRLTPYVDLDH